MTKVFDDAMDHDTAWDQFHQAVEAVIERTVDRNELYGNIICDQMLFIACNLMQEKYGGRRDVVVRNWCDENIDHLEGHFQRSRALVDSLMADQEKEDGKKKP